MHVGSDRMTPLYCCGCGRFMVNLEAIQGRVWSQSCSCGAYSPILVTDLQEGVAIASTLPSSLFMAIKDKRKPPHLDVYLGRSDFTSPAKTSWEKQLTELGAVWKRDCPECVAERVAEIGEV